MRLAVALIIVLLMVCAALASNARKPFELRIDAQSPGVWPQYAGNALDRPISFICRPMIITNGPDKPKPISRT